MTTRRSTTQRQSRPGLATIGLVLLVVGGAWLLLVLGVIP